MADSLAQSSGRHEGVTTPDSPEKMAQRKNDHISICLTKDVESKAPNFDSVSLLPEALPNFKLADVQTEQSFLGKRFALPILITGMTGGVERGRYINEVLADAAQTFGIPLGLGSQKMMLVDPGFKQLFDVRRAAPKAFVIGNLGLSCFNYGVSVDDVARLVDELELGAMAFHVNALQEAIQPEGETDFTNLAGHLERVCRALPCPVMVKEVGSGMTAATVLQLARAGVSAIDVGGASGTSWGYIEGQRGGVLSQRLGEVFRNWGLSTPAALAQALMALGVSETPGMGELKPLRDREVQSAGARKAPDLVATGGIRDGLQVAKAVASGATMVGIGLPFLKAVMAGGDDSQLAKKSVFDEIEFFAQGLRIAQFASGARSLDQLADRVVTPSR